MASGASYDESYDFVVIGGGSAGCIVAARLAQTGVGSVLLLEAGDPAERNPQTLDADGFVHAFSSDSLMLDRLSSAQPRCSKRHLYMGSGTGLGGSGAVNGMVYTRGDQQDYAQWPQGWHWPDVASVFEQLEQQLRVRTRSGTTFTNTCLDASLQAGFQRKDELNDGDLCGFIGYQLMNFEGSQRRSSYVAFLHGQQHPNLTIKTNARVQRILFDEKRTAVAVEFRQNHGIRKVGIRRELVLAAGALETPKLLMLSGVGAKNDLKHWGIDCVLDAPEVGKNLQDHPNVCVFYRGNQQPDSFYPQLYGFERVNAELPLPTGQADTCFVFYAAHASIQQSMQRMLPSMLLPPHLYRQLSARRLVKQLVNLMFLVPFVRRFVSKVYGVVVILGKPLSRGEVRLAAKDAAEPALINPGYFLNPADMETMVEGVLKAQQIAQQAAFSSWGNRGLSQAARTQDRDAIRQWIKSAAMTTFHYAGTCRMGAAVSDPVDLNLRLRGLRNVRVADASVIPEIPVSALNAPSMMIGWRAADFILQDSKAVATKPESTIAEAVAAMPAKVEKARPAPV